MRLTEAQIRRAVRGILTEALLPAYPEPDRGIAKIIDAIGLNLRRQAESDPDFAPMRDVAARPRLYIQMKELVTEKYMTEIERISRLMLKQAQKLEPVLDSGLKDIASGLTAAQQDVTGIPRYRGIDDDELDKPWEYDDSGLPKLQVSVILALVSYLFPAPHTLSGFEDDRLSRYTDSRVYGIFGLVNYQPPGFRGEMEKRMQAAAAQEEDEPDFVID